MIIYVAGRYRARNYFGIVRNIFKAWRESLNLWRMGHVPLCPHLNSLWMSEWPVSEPAETFLGGDIDLLRVSDAILMLPGWEQSAGARGEHFWALENGRPIYYSLAEIPPDKS